MVVFDLECCNCGKTYEAHELGTSFLIGLLDGNEIESEELHCPYCGSVKYTERHIDDPWDEE